jgi:hypothetical protein
MIQRATLLFAATFALFAAVTVGLYGCDGEHTHAAALTSVARTGGQRLMADVEVRRELHVAASAAPVDPAGHDVRHDVYGNPRD